jgi:hypothetical protein
MTSKTQIGTWLTAAAALILAIWNRLDIRGVKVKFDGWLVKYVSAKDQAEPRRRKTGRAQRGTPERVEPLSR